LDELIFFIGTISVACIIAGFIGLTNNPISRYLMRDLENEKNGDLT